MATVAASRAPTPRLLAGRLLFCEEAREPRPSCTYPRVQLLEQWLPRKRAISWLSQVPSAGIALDGVSIPAKFDGGQVDSHTSGKWGATGWSRHIVRCTLERDRRQHGLEPVAAAGLPPYPDVATAAREWVFPDSHERWNDQIPYEGQLQIEVPDTRGQILEAVWEEDRVHTAMQWRAGHGLVELQVLFQGSVLNRFLRFPSPSTPTNVLVPPDARAVRLILVVGQDILADVELSRLRPAYGRQRSEIELTLRIDRDLTSGESQHVEYKPFVRASDKKEHELVRTVVAFANSDGGKLYIGVDAHGQLQGDVELRRAFPNTPDPLDAAMRRVRELLAEGIRPGAPVEVDRIDFEGQPLLLVRVHKSETTLFCTQARDTFVRKGASNMKADPHTELPAMMQRTRGIP
jgi:hypothetical protein